MLEIFLSFTAVFLALLFVDLRLLKGVPGLVLAAATAPFVTAWLLRRLRGGGGSLLAARFGRDFAKRLDDDLVDVVTVTERRVRAIAAMKRDLPGISDYDLERRLADLLVSLADLALNLTQMRRATPAFGFERADAELKGYYDRLAAEWDPDLAEEYRRTIRSLEESIRENLEIIRMNQIAFAKVERIYYFVQTLELKAIRLREAARDGRSETQRIEMEELAQEIDGITEALRELDRDAGVPPREGGPA